MKKSKQISLSYLHFSNSPNPHSSRPTPIPSVPRCKFYQTFTPIRISTYDPQNMVSFSRIFRSCRKISTQVQNIPFVPSLGCHFYSLKLRINTFHPLRGFINILGPCRSDFESKIKHATQFNAWIKIIAVWLFSICKSFDFTSTNPTVWASST